MSQHDPENLGHIYRLNQELGQLQGRTAGLEQRLEGLERRIDDRLKAQGEEIKSLSDKLDDVLQILAEGRGSWKTLSILAAGIAAFAGAVAWIVDTAKDFMS